MKIKTILSQGAFWQINKALAQNVGLEAALLLSDLIDRESYFENRDMLVNINGEGFFFVTSEQIEQSTTLSYHKQRKCLKTLLLKFYESDLNYMKLAEYTFNECQGMLSIKKMKAIML